MRSSTHYNDPVVIEVSQEELTAEGRTLVWAPVSAPVMANVRFEEVKSKPDNSSTIEVAESYIVGFRDNVLKNYPLKNIRLRYGTDYLYPMTYLTPLGGEYRGHFTKEEDHGTRT